MRAFWNSSNMQTISKCTLALWCVCVSWLAAIWRGSSNDACDFIFVLLLIRSKKFLFSALNNFFQRLQLHHIECDDKQRKIKIKRYKFKIKDKKWKHRQKFCLIMKSFDFLTEKNISGIFEMNKLNEKSDLRAIFLFVKADLKEEHFMFSDIELSIKMLLSTSQIRRLDCETKYLKMKMISDDFFNNLIKFVGCQYKFCHVRWKSNKMNVEHSLKCFHIFFQTNAYANWIINKHDT